MRIINGWRLLKMIYALRAVGLSISIQDMEEVLTALHRYPDLPVKRVFSSILIRRQEEYPLFEAVWNVIHLPEAPALAPETSGKADGCPNQGQGFGNGTWTLAAGNFVNRYKEFATPKTLETLLTTLLLQDNENLQDLLFSALGQSGSLSWINSAELAFSRQEITADEFKHLTSLYGMWKDNLRQELRSQFIVQKNDWSLLRDMHWQHKPLNSFTGQEDQQIRRIIHQMGKRLATRPGSRRKIASKGHIRFAAAIKEMVRGNGVIRRLEFEKPIPKHPELVVLCDVSNSVAPFSDFLIFMLKGLRMRFRRVRIFLFIDSLWDISQENWQEDENFGQSIRSWGRKHTSGYSDYGNVFKEFNDQWLSEISARSTLLILGDGRNNFRPAHADYLAVIRNKLKRILWLNPLAETNWQDRDNALKEYAPHCSQIMRCRTIADLWRISRMIL